MRGRGSGGGGVGGCTFFCTLNLSYRSCKNSLTKANCACCWIMDQGREGLPGTGAGSAAPRWTCGFLCLLLPSGKKSATSPPSFFPPSLVSSPTATLILPLLGSSTSFGFFFFFFFFRFLQKFQSFGEGAEMGCVTFYRCSNFIVHLFLDAECAECYMHSLKIGLKFHRLIKWKYGILKITCITPKKCF